MRAALLTCAVIVLIATALAQNPNAPSAQTNNLATPSPTTTSTATTANTTTAPTPPAQVSGFALVRIYRHRRYTGSALSPTITLDGKPVARIGNGRRVTLRVPPGTHTIASDDKSSAIELDAKPGQEYFIRVDEETGFWKGHGKLTMLMPEQGSPEYKKSKPLETDRRIDKELIDEAETDAGATGN